MLRELGKVLIDHVQSRFENGIEDGRDLGCKKLLKGELIGSLRSVAE